MYVASLSSSSTYGNAYVVWDENARPVLIDCGLSLKRMVSGLGCLGFRPQDVQALFITHEHSDHVKAMCLKHPFPERYQIPVFSSRGFWNWYLAHGTHIDSALIRTVSHLQRVKLDGVQVMAFRKPHDAAEPLGFIVESSSGKTALVMDLGHLPGQLEGLLRDSTCLVLESNHDVDMEISSGRPWPLVQRVIGEYGHLSNDQASGALERLVTKNTKAVVLAHLSIDCNTPEKALCSARKALRSETGLYVCPAGEVNVFPQV